MRHKRKGPVLDQGPLRGRNVPKNCRRIDQRRNQLHRDRGSSSYRGKGLQARRGKVTIENLDNKGRNVGEERRLEA